MRVRDHFPRACAISLPGLTRRKMARLSEMMMSLDRFLQGVVGLYQTAAQGDSTVRTIASSPAADRGYRTEEMTTSQPWMRYGPTSKQEVIVLFTLLLPYLPIRFELDEVRGEFPDCLATRIDLDGTRWPVRIEFELYASQFRLHGHDPKACDLIVCWEDDLPNFQVPRLELRPFAELAAPPVIALPIRLKYEATVWNESTFLAECSSKDRPLHAQLLAWAKSRGEVVFGKGAKRASWAFQIVLPEAKRRSLFGVNANSTLWANWQKLPVDIAERYKQELRLAPRFKDAIESGKAWSEPSMHEAAVLPALQAAVDAVVAHLRG